jgi:hypothetical protein
VKPIDVEGQIKNYLSDLIKVAMCIYNAGGKGNKASFKIKISSKSSQLMKTINIRGQEFQQ